MNMTAFVITITIFELIGLGISIAKADEKSTAAILGTILPRLVIGGWGGYLLYARFAS